MLRTAAVLGLALVLLVLFSCEKKGTQPDPEPAEDITLISVSRTSWHMSSSPGQLDTNFYARGKLLWHQPRLGIPTTDIYNRDVPPGASVWRTFRIVFRPATYLYPDAAQRRSWAGFTTYLGNMYDNHVVDTFEVRLRGFGRLHLDLGRISEDINGDALVASEDMDHNGAVDESEDLGLDMLADEYEPGYHPDTLPDPHGDNWFFLGEGKSPVPAAQRDLINWDDESIRYEWLNGTEGNISDASVQGAPDRETLNSHSTFSWTNSYRSWTIDLADTAFLVEGSEIGDPYRPWRTFRIPLLDPARIDTIVGDPASQRLEYMRVWFEASDPSSTGTDTVEIAHWKFTLSDDTTNVQ